MQASSAKEPFDNQDWIFETKLDGFRAIAVIDSSGKARPWSRNRLPLEPKFPSIRDATEELKLRSTVLDGRSWHWIRKESPGFNCSSNGGSVQPLRSSMFCLICSFAPHQLIGDRLLTMGQFIRPLPHTKYRS
jgi:hypothetical protein